MYINDKVLITSIDTNHLNLWPTAVQWNWLRQHCTANGKLSLSTCRAKAAVKQKDLHAMCGALCIVLNLIRSRCIIVHNWII